MKRIIMSCLVAVLCLNAHNSVTHANEILNNEIITEIENISLYPVPRTKRDSSPYDKFDSAIKIVEEHYGKEGISVSNDIDDVEYQQQVMSLAFAFDRFDEDSFAKVLEFAKFIDLYENIEKNRKIEVLLKKYKDGIITSEEIYELLSLAPMDTSDAMVNISIDEYLNSQNSNELDIVPLNSYENNYSRHTAIQYARRWTDNNVKLRNTEKYGYYSINANDCANFVSQCLFEGGMGERSGLWTDSLAWYYRALKPSHSWGGAKNFYDHWRRRANIAAVPGFLKIGDVVSIDISGDPDPEHTVIVTIDIGTSQNGNGARHKHITGHSQDIKEFQLDGSPYTVQTLFDRGYGVYGICMEYAS